MFKQMAYIFYFDTIVFFLSSIQEIYGRVYKVCHNSYIILITEIRKSFRLRAFMLLKKTSNARLKARSALSRRNRVTKQPPGY
jgi:hypothetical protein